MSEWQPIETAPKDSTHVIVRTPDGSLFTAAYVPGFLDSNDNDCWCWVALSDLHPDDWSGGTCWEVNEDGESSQHPTHWMPLPTLPIEQRADASELSRDQFKDGVSDTAAKPEE